MSANSSVALVLIDGLRPDALAKVHCPNLDSLRASGASTLHGSSITPSITLPCHMSTFFSVPATRHGITTNEWTPMARPLPGLVDVAHEAGLHCAFFYNWGPIRDLCRPGSLEYGYFRHSCRQPRGDHPIAEEAVRYFASDHPDFAFLYFGLLDWTGHVHGWMSDEYLQVLEQADDALGIVLNGLQNGATVVVHADHGGHDRVHGTGMPEDMTIPWIIAGPQIKKGYEIEGAVSLLETAPTAARILGIEPHPEWEGHCVEEAFK